MASSMALRSWAVSAPRLYGEAAEGDQLVHRQAQVEAGRLAQRGHAPGVVGDADGAGVAAVQQDLALAGRLQPRHQH